MGHSCAILGQAANSGHKAWGEWPLMLVTKGHQSTQGLLKLLGFALIPGSYARRRSECYGTDFARRLGEVQCLTFPATFCRCISIALTRQKQKRPTSKVGLRNDIRLASLAHASRFLRSSRTVLAPNGSSSKAPAIIVVGSGTTNP